MFSIADQIVISGTEAWELPSYQTEIYTRRQNRFALVIPVINEGERIRRQLVAIRDAELPVDVVLADAGSVDGSLDTAFIGGVGVRAVLTKTGHGRLGSQLRMAYAWCLREGYDGIITIDGNSKDGIEAIANMAIKLQEGYDYVQGSRYLPGGVAENTPLERTIANRLIHAPLLSLAGRRWFTDTTNGFRAYSARYLLDPRVQPFRDIFQGYEILFYLTVRAGQIGMKVCQVPVARRYPKSGKVPTKINGLKSKIQVLIETVSVATGGYMPSSEKCIYPRWGVVFVLLITIATPMLIGSIYSPKFSSDSWAYYELGQTVFHDFYRFSHFRSYWSSSPYSSSFPPLFPILIAAFDALTSVGARSGLLVAFLGFLIFAIMAEQIGRRVFSVAWLGLSTASILLLGPGMLFDEITGGRSIPIHLLLLSGVLLCMIKIKKTSISNAIGVGLFSGMAALNRFDAILLPFLAATGVYYFTRRLILPFLVILIAVIVNAPWIAYSITKFDVLFVSDNASVARSIDPKAWVTDWWPFPQKTIFDDPQAWVRRLLKNAVKFPYHLVRAGINRMGMVFSVALFPMIVLQNLSRPISIDKMIANRLTDSKRIFIVFTLISITLLVPQVITGYYEARYFTPAYWCIFLLVGGSVVEFGRTAHQRQRFAEIMFIFVAVIVFFSSGNYLRKSAFSGDQKRFQWSEFDKPNDIRMLVEIINGDMVGRILVLGDNKLAARVGALTGLPMMMEPRNMANGRLDSDGSRKFVQAWNVSYVLVANPTRQMFAEKTFNLERLSGCNLLLYRVVK